MLMLMVALLDSILLPHITLLGSETFDAGAGAGADVGNDDTAADFDSAATHPLRLTSHDAATALQAHDAAAAPTLVSHDAAAELQAHEEAIALDAANGGGAAAAPTLMGHDAAAALHAST
ncbi:unnamed protein product [Closterium sp. NIES-54]